MITLPSNDIVKHIDGFEYKVIETDNIDNTVKISRKGEVEIKHTDISVIEKKVKRKNLKKFIDTHFEDINPIIHFSYKDQDKEGLVDSNLKKEDLMTFIEKFPFLYEVNVKLDKRKERITKQMSTIIKIVPLSELQLVRKHESKSEKEIKEVIENIQDLSLDEATNEQVEQYTKKKRLYRPPQPRLEQIKNITDENLNKLYINEVFKNDVSNRTLSEFNKISRDTKNQAFFNYKLKEWKKEIGKINTLENKMIELERKNKLKKENS